MNEIGTFDILGPNMIGPSSSHTAGALRIAFVAGRMVERAVSVKFVLYGSFARTYHGHGTDRALVAGLLGMRPDDLRIACFCHGGFGGTWIAHLFGMMPVMAWLKLDLHTASVTRFDFRDEFDSGYATARCSYINDISHLKAAGLAHR